MGEAASAPQAAPDDARLAALEAVLALELAQRRQAGRRMEAWFYTYLPGLFYADAGAFHRRLYSDVEALLWKTPLDGGEVFDSAAIACPRGHGKSTMLAIGLPLWVALEWEGMPHFKRAPYIVIVSDTADQAKARLADIRDQLEGNSELIARYGHQAPQGSEGQRRRQAGRRRQWKQDTLELANGVIIRALGQGSKRVRGLVRDGRRPSLLLVDDLENDEAVDTEEQRNKLRSWFTKALIPVGLEGEVLTLVLGTILHADALLTRLLSAEHFPTFLKRRYAALVNDQGEPDSYGTRPLWPEYWTLHALERRRAKIGSLAFAQEYLNIPIDDAAAIFRQVWLEAAKRRGQGRGFLYERAPRISFEDSISTWDVVHLATLAPADAYQVVVTGWDFGLVDDEDQAKARDSDYTVGVTLGLLADDRIELRRIWRGRGLTPNAVRERVIGEQHVVGADYIVVENNQAQRLHEIALRDLGLPIVGHTTDRKRSSLWEGVPGLALMFETGRIALCWDHPAELQRVQVLVGELHGLGFEAHDDTVMALWFATLTIRKWIRIRNARRRKLIGEAPPGYYDDLFPQREAA